MSSAPGREGAALLLAVLLTTAATLLAHGILVLAVRELGASRASARLVRVEHLAAGAAERAADALPRADVPAGGGAMRVAADSVGAALWEAGLRRLSPEVWLAEGRASEGRARRASARVLWRLDPEARLARLGPGLTAGPGAPQLVPGTGRPISLGMLDLDELVERADVTVAGRGTPGAMERHGECLDDPWNWGDTASVFCGGRVVHVAAAADTYLEAGAGQGLLVGRGDVTLDGTRFEGLLLADGTVRLTGAAVVSGMVVARGGVELGPDARLSESGPALAAALAARSLAEPLPIPGSAPIRLNR